MSIILPTYGNNSINQKEPIVVAQMNNQSITNIEITDDSNDSDDSELEEMPIDAEEAQESTIILTSPMKPITISNDILCINELSWISSTSSTSSTTSDTTVADKIDIIFDLLMSVVSGLFCKFWCIG